MPKHLASSPSSTKALGVYGKPSHLLLFVVVTIFVSEWCIMIFLEYLPPLTNYQEALFDATLLSIIVFPSLYFLFFKPLITYISIRQRAEDEKNTLITELHAALAEVKTLKGIIPICSYCKKIRDDEGVWKQLEAYIYSHSSAEFSHGLCPECYKKQLEVLAIKYDEIHRTNSSVGPENGTDQ